MQTINTTLLSELVQPRELIFSLVTTIVEYALSSSLVPEGPRSARHKHPPPQIPKKMYSFYHQRYRLMSFRPRKPVERCYEIRYGADTPAYLLMLFELYFIHGKITLYLLYSHGSAENHCFCYFLSVPQNAFIAGNYDTSADHDNMFFQIKVPVPSLSVTP